MVTEERVDEVRTLLATLRGWAHGHPDVVAVGLASSWARGDKRMDSDVDVVLLTENQCPTSRTMHGCATLAGSGWCGRAGEDR